MDAMNGPRAHASRIPETDDSAMRLSLNFSWRQRALADAPIPLHLVAFDLAEGREVLVSRGPALESVIAAASIPGVCPRSGCPGRKP